jgi:hypothetical protein
MAGKRRGGGGGRGREEKRGKEGDYFENTFNNWYRCCGLQAIKYCANLPLARIGAQVPAWLAPMTAKQSLLPPRAGRIN